MFQFFDLGFKFGDRLLEIEEIHCHRGARIAEGARVPGRRSGVIGNATPGGAKNGLE
jgi:hypothetical protein